MIFLLHQYKWKVFWILPSATLASAFYVLHVSIQKELFVTARTREGFNLYNQLVYMPTHSRLGAWIVGMSLGFVMYQRRTKRLHMKQWLEVILWIFSLAILVSIVVAAQPFYVQGADNTTTLHANAFFTAFPRLGWAIGLSWIVFACQNKSGGLIRRALSMPWLQVISKLGLSMYLVHLIYQHLLIMNTQQPIYFDEWQWINSFFGDVVATVILATVLHLTVEQPFCMLEQSLHKRLTTKL